MIDEYPEVKVIIKLHQYTNSYKHLREIFDDSDRDISTKIKYIYKDIYYNRLINYNYDDNAYVSDIIIKYMEQPIGIDYKLIDNINNILDFRLEELTAENNELYKSITDMVDKKYLFTTTYNGVTENHIMLLPELERQSNHSFHVLNSSIYSKISGISTCLKYLYKLREWHLNILSGKTYKLKNEIIKLEIVMKDTISSRTKYNVLQLTVYSLYDQYRKNIKLMNKYISKMNSLKYIDKHRSHGNVNNIIYKLWTPNIDLKQLKN